MALDPRTPMSDLERIAAELRDLRQQVRALSSPSGTQQAGVVNYLTGLTTSAEDYYGVFDTGTVPNDGVSRFFDLPTVLELTNVNISTGRFLVTTSCSEAYVQSGGAWSRLYVTYEVVDANGVVPAGLTTGFRYGSVYTNQSMGVALRTPDYPIYLNPTSHPGPYTIRGKVGVSVDTANTTPVFARFAFVTLRVEVLGDQFA